MVKVNKDFTTILLNKTHHRCDELKDDSENDFFFK